MSLHIAFSQHPLTWDYCRNTILSCIFSFNHSIWMISLPTISLCSYPPQPSAPPSITSLMSSNVTGTSFCIYWSSQSQENHTYGVAVSKGSEVIHLGETSQAMMEVTGLQPGVLYNVTVTPCACGVQGVPLSITVKTGKINVPMALSFDHLSLFFESSSYVCKSIHE